MASIEKFTGNFVYQAIALPKRFRHAQLVDMYGKTEYAIPKVAPSEVKLDAVRILESETEDLPQNRISFVGWNGRLWRPATSGPPTTIEQYKRRFRDGWPQAGKGNFVWHLPADEDYGEDPFLSSIDYDLAIRKGDGGGLNTPIGTYDEESFEGSVISSNRNAALNRLEAAARHLLIIDDEVYFAFPEPVWGCFPFKDTHTTSVEIRLVHLTAHDGDWRNNSRKRAYGGKNYIHEDKCFRLDRLEDAKAWVWATYGQVAVTVEGKIDAMDPSYLAQDDIALALRGALPNLMSYANRLPLHLSAQGAAAWKTLSDATRSITLYDNGLIDGDYPRLIDALRVLQAETTQSFFPATEIYSAGMAAKFSTEILQRIDFELELRRNLNADDETALSTLAV